MPFTGSHVVAVLPLWRVRRLDPTCMAVGAMAPDFQYFVLGTRAGDFSHSLFGALVFSLPMALLVAFAWQRWGKWLVLEALPQVVARRAAPLAAPRWPRTHPAWLVVSAAFGVATHLFWDGFTHGGQFVTSKIPWLDVMIGVPVLGRIPRYRVVQHVSTLVGLAILAWFVPRALARQAPAPPDPDARPLRVWIVAIVVAAALFPWLSVRLRRYHMFEAGNIVVAVISASLAGAIAAAIVFHRRLGAIRRARTALDPP